MLPTATSGAQPDSRTDGEVPVDRERLTYVARAVSGRQGLWMIGLGTFLFLTALWDMHWSGPKGWLVGFACLALGVAFLVEARRDFIDIDRYYQKRFGFVGAAHFSAKEGTGFLGGCAVLLLILVAVFFFTTFGKPTFSAFSGRVHLMLSDPARQINLWPSFFWMGLFLISLRRRPGRIARQDSYFFISGLLAFTFIPVLAAWHPAVRQSELWRMLNAGGYGLSFIAWGLFDHIRLTLLLPRRVAEHDDE